MNNITLKPQRQPDLLIHVFAWLFLVLTYYFFCKWADTLPSANRNTSPMVSTIIVALISIPTLWLSAYLTENQKMKSRRWSIGRDTIQFVQSGFGSVKLEVQVCDIASIRFETYNLLLERGIKIRDKNGVKIFIPQLTDRFFEAEQFLRGLIQKSPNDT